MIVQQDPKPIIRFGAPSFPEMRFDAEDDFSFPGLARARRQAP